MRKIPQDQTEKSIKDVVGEVSRISSETMGKSKQGECVKALEKHLLEISSG